VPIAHVNGINLWYEVRGIGEPIAQVHGSIIGHVNFAPITPLLAQEFRVLDFDMRGFGQSEKPLQKYTMETWADDLAALLDELHLEAVHVHGTSMGGLVGVQFAAKYPERTRGLVLDCTLARYDTAAAINKRVWKAITAAYGWSDPFWDLLAFQCFSREYLESDRADEGIALLKQSVIADTPREVFVAVSDAVETADMVPLLPRVKAPTLIMIGEHDILTPYELGPKGAGAKVLQDVIPNAETAMIAGSGHINLYEKPEESARIIADFLRSNAVQATASLAVAKGA
jgi:pimeloyl-ACP methyl ester carboxylesterase